MPYVFIIFRGINPLFVCLIQTSSGNENFHSWCFHPLQRYKSTVHWYNPNSFSKIYLPFLMRSSSSDIWIHCTLYYLNSFSECTLYSGFLLHLPWYKSTSCCCNPNSSKIVFTFWMSSSPSVVQIHCSLV